MNLRSPHRRIPLLLSVLLAACAAPHNKPPGDTHLEQAAVPLPDAGIPAPVQPSLAVPKPKSSARTETYSVVVNNVRVHDLLFALARDAKVNVDVHPGLQGNVTLNAIDQTLPQILDRLARQADLRWELDGQNLSVMPDTPYLQTYRVDYLNMNRDTTGSINVSGEIASTTTGTVGGTGTNGSTTKIDNSAKNRFWETLTQNIKDILRETDRVLPEGSSDTQMEQSNIQTVSNLIGQIANTASGNKSSAGQQPGSQQATATTTVKRSTFREAASVIANPETGVLTVRATARQQEKIQQFLDQVLSSAKRQVLIEATIAEVALSRQYEQGVDWGRFTADASRAGIRGQALNSIGAAQLLIGSSSTASADVAIRLLETFGTVKVLSSPKISVINNQSAVLKVVDNEVYFLIKVEPGTTNTAGQRTDPVFSTEPKVVPVGFVMNITPQISESDEIILNVRPSITRVLNRVQDPNPELVKNDGTTIESLVPVIRTREMESVIRLSNGNIAVMGGLMDDRILNNDSAVPWFHTIPVFGALFAQKNNTVSKSELVVFLRPTVIREPGFTGDYYKLRNHLPSKGFFDNNPGARYQLLPSDSGPGGDKK